MSTPFYELTMEQGEDWWATINCYTGPIFRAPIEEIESGYPTKIRVSSHLLPTSSDTPVIISGVVGMEILNSADLGIELCERVDDDYFLVPISTVSCAWVTGTGEITWHRPSDIDGYTARCKLRKKWHTSDVIAELTTENGGITLDANDGSVTMNLTDTQTEAFTFVTCFFDMELIAPDGTIWKAFKGRITMSREHTY